MRAPRRSRAPARPIDTSSWFESQLPPAAAQPEARIEMSSIADAGPALPSPQLPPTTELARAAENGVVRQDGTPPPA